MVYLVMVIFLAIMFSVFVVNSDNLYDYETWMHKYGKKDKEQQK